MRLLCCLLQCTLRFRYRPLGAMAGYIFKQLTMSKADIDERDPYRSATGNPLYAASYKLDTNGNMLYEFWPHPVTQQPLLTLYRTDGGSLTNDDDPLPPQASRQLVESLALVNAITWMELNQTIVPGAALMPFGRMKADALALYNSELATAWTADDERCLPYFIKYNPLTRVPGVLTGAWLQAHDGYGLLFD